PLHLGEEGGSVHTRHTHVAHDDVERRPVERFQRRRSIGREDHLPVVSARAEHPLQPLEHPALVVHKPHARHHAASFRSASRSPVGRRTVKVVPTPTSDSSRTVPPCCSTTIACTNVSPWPVPRPTSLVVKNGSKIRCRISSGMPVPVSLTRTS